MTEQQRYRVVGAHGDVELREYDAFVCASVDIDGSVQQAGNAAFRPLFNYISGANRSATPLAMTAPVIQQSAGERLAMTAPVLQETAGAGAWRVSFVLPGSRPLEEYPEPTDPRVSLHAVPAELAAALRWSGRWTASNIARWTDRLRRQVADAGWQVTGEARWARFDPPWQPPFMRHNEVVIPVSV